MKIFGAVFFVLMIFSIGFAQTSGEVIVPKTFLRKSPNPSGAIVQTVFKGVRFKIKKESPKSDWLFVSVADEKYSGWIVKNAVRLTDDIAEPKPVAAPPPTIQNSAATQENPAKNTPVQAETPKKAEDTPVEENEVLLVETEEVSLNIRVVDENNRAVNNLRQSQFEVFEDGVLQPITSFLTTEVPIVNVLLIDNSRSLRSQLKKVAEAGKILVEANKPKDETSVIRFVSSSKFDVVQDFTSDKSSLNNALDNLFVEGGETAIIDAIFEATRKAQNYKSSQKNEDVKIRALILVSDGDDRASKHTEKELLDLLRGSQVQIYTVGFVGNLPNEADAEGVNRQQKARDLLNRLAQETGGKSYFPDSSEQLSQIASEISGELRTQYIVSYSPTNTNRDGSFRKINVKITDDASRAKRNAITRTGRTAAPK